MDGTSLPFLCTSEAISPFFFMYFFYLPPPSAGRVDASGGLYIRLTPRKFPNRPNCFRISERTRTVVAYSSHSFLDCTAALDPSMQKLVEYLGSGGRLSQQVAEYFLHRASMRSIQDSARLGRGPNSAIPSQALQGSGKVHKTNTASVWEKKEA